MSHDYEYVQEVVVDEWPSDIIIKHFSDHGREDDQKITAVWNSRLSVTLKRRLEACLAGGAEYSYAASS
jgi:hypothetical protein